MFSTVLTINATNTRLHLYQQAVRTLQGLKCTLWLGGRLALAVVLSRKIVILDVPVVSTKGKFNQKGRAVVCKRSCESNI